MRVRDGSTSTSITSGTRCISASKLCEPDQASFFPSSSLPLRLSPSLPIPSPFLSRLFFSSSFLCSSLPLFLLFLPYLFSCCFIDWCRCWCESQRVLKLLNPSDTVTHVFKLCLFPYWMRWHMFGSSCDTRTLFSMFGSSIIRNALPVLC